MASGTEYFLPYLIGIQESEKPICLFRSFITKHMGWWCSLFGKVFTQQTLNPEFHSYAYNPITWEVESAGSVQSHVQLRRELKADPGIRENLASKWCSTIESSSGLLQGVIKVTHLSVVYYSSGLDQSVQKPHGNLSVLLSWGGQSNFALRVVWGLCGVPLFLWLALFSLFCVAFLVLCIYSCP